MREKITVLGHNITFSVYGGMLNLSLTDIARWKHPTRTGNAITHWIRNRVTLGFLEAWEREYNPDFKVPNIGDFSRGRCYPHRIESVNSWTATTNAKGISAGVGRHGGTFAHFFIAFEFAGWIHPRYKFHLSRAFYAELTKVSLS